MTDGEKLRAILNLVGNHQSEVRKAICRAWDRTLIEEALRTRERMSDPLREMMDILAGKLSRASHV